MAMVAVVYQLSIGRLHLKAVDLVQRSAVTCALFCMHQVNGNR